MKKSSRPRQSDLTPLLTRGVALQQKGDSDGALTCYTEILKTYPRQPDALHLSGIIATQKGNYARAVDLIAKAIEVSPYNAMYHVNIANALEAMGRESAAEEHLRRAIKLDSAYAPAFFNLGNLLIRQERDNEAVQCYDRAIVANPSHFAACLALGQLLLKLKQAAPARQLAMMALNLQPTDSRANDLLISALLLLKEFAPALERIDLVLSEAPSRVPVLKGKAHCLQELVRIEEAIAVYRTILSIEPGDIESRLALGRLFTFSGQVKQGIEALGQPVAATQSDADVFSTWLFYLNYLESHSATELRCLHQRWEEGRHPPRLSPRIHRVDTPKARLKVGYLSADFKTHSVAFFIESVLEQHDVEKFEIFAYYLGPESDAVTERISSKVEHFRPVHGLQPEEIAHKIAEDGIDIAIDLGAHTTSKLLEALLFRPAPIQISWLGYPNTTGVSAIDYRITDAIADPPGTGDTWNSEKLLRLPDCFHCYRPEQYIPFDPTPAYRRNGFVTFGSFNVLPKLSASCLSAWARIINGTPKSRLLIKTRYLRDPSAQSHLFAQFKSHGLPENRIIIASDQARWSDHLLRYREIDIALDPFPYNGTTTTCEALWMGVPVLTFTGDRHAARVGTSLLTTIRHPELIAENQEAYIAQAIQLANTPEELDDLHARLHDDMARSPLCNAVRFVAHLESTYQAAWKNYCETAG